MEGHVCEKRCFNLRAIAATSPAPLPLPSSANKSLNWKKFLMWESLLHGTEYGTQFVAYLSNCQELNVKDNCYIQSSTKCQVRAEVTMKEQCWGNILAGQAYCLLLLHRNVLMKYTDGHVQWRLITDNITVAEIYCEIAITILTYILSFKVWEILWHYNKYHCYKRDLTSYIFQQ